MSSKNAIGKKKALITGATGNVGYEIILSLLDHVPETEIVAGCRNLEKDSEKFNGLAVKTIHFDFENPTGFAMALKDIDLLFLLRPPQLSDVKGVFTPLISAAKAARISQIVFLSVQGAASNPQIPHYKIEQLIKQSKLPYVFLRPAYFMQNFTSTLKEDLLLKNEIFLPAGNAKFTLIDVQDVGRVGAKIILEPARFLNQEIDLTNREQLTFGEMAEQLSEVLKRKINFVSPNLVAFFFRKRREKVPPMFILVMIMLHYLPRFQKTPPISEAVKDITGIDPTTFKEFLVREKEKLIMRKQEP